MFKKSAPYQELVNAQLAPNETTSLGLNGVTRDSRKQAIEVDAIFLDQCCLHYRTQDGETFALHKRVIRRVKLDDRSLEYVVKLVGGGRIKLSCRELDQFTTLAQQTTRVGWLKPKTGLLARLKSKHTVVYKPF